MWVLLQFTNDVTFCFSTAYSRECTRQQTSSERNQGVSEHHSNIISAHMWPLLTNLWNCSSPHYGHSVCTAELQSANIKPGEASNGCLLNKTARGFLPAPPPTHRNTIISFPLWKTSNNVYWLNRDYIFLIHLNDMTSISTNIFGCLCLDSLLLFSHIGFASLNTVGTGH